MSVECHVFLSFIMLFGRKFSTRMEGSFRLTEPSSTGRCWDSRRDSLFIAWDACDVGCPFEGPCNPAYLISSATSSFVLDHTKNNKHQQKQTHDLTWFGLGPTSTRSQRD